MMFYGVTGEEIVRSYTPVCHLDNQAPDDTLHFIIKIYKDGALTQYIDSLKPGELV